MDGGSKRKTTCEMAGGGGGGGHRCPAEATLCVIGGRWKVPIVWHLCAGTRRFGELRKGLGDVTPKTLAQQLRELERDGVVTRTVYAEVPPRVEYCLTKQGQSLKPIVDAMCKWSKRRKPAQPTGAKASSEHT